MLRLATYDDIPQLVDGMLKLKQHTGWKVITYAGYDAESLQQHWRAALGHPFSIVYVYELDGRIIGFCAASLARYPLPPYMVVLHEWGWYGDHKAATTCWRAVREWGKRKGAVFAMRATSKPGKRKDRVYESLVWEVL